MNLQAWRAQQRLGRPPTHFTDILCDYCNTNAARREAHKAPNGTKLYFCDACRDVNALTVLIADVCQRNAPLTEHIHR